MDIDYVPPPIVDVAIEVSLDGGRTFLPSPSGSPVIFKYYNPGPLKVTAINYFSFRT